MDYSDQRIRIIKRISFLELLDVIGIYQSG